MRDEFLACGLTPTEYEVFHHLLTRGPRSAGVIARAIGLKRSTVYSALQMLENQQLVKRTSSKGVAEFVPIHPDEIAPILFNQARANFEKMLASIELIKPRLEQYKPHQTIHVGKLEINHIDHSKDYYLLIEKYVLKHDFCAMWNPQASILDDVKRGKVKAFLELTGKTKNRIQEILARGPVTEWYCQNITNPNHEVRFLDPNEAGLADVMVVGDVTIMSLNSPGDESALELIHPDYATFMRWFFSSLWSRLQN